MRIGAVLHPAVRLALLDGASFLEHVNRPIRAASVLPVFGSRVISMEILPIRRIVSSAIRFRLLTHGWDSQWRELKVWRVIARELSATGYALGGWPPDRGICQRDLASAGGEEWKKRYSDASDHNLGRADRRSRGNLQGLHPRSSCPFVRPARAGPGSREPSRGASRPCGFDPSRKRTSCPSGRTKTGPLCSHHLHKGPALSCLATILNGCKGPFHTLWRGFALRPGCDPEAQSLSRGYDYFFFFEVFLATFLVAAIAVFFAFFAFLPCRPL